jgi:HKD family nuclease
MKLLTTTSAINTELLRLLRECSKCQIAVAWASVGFDAFTLLKRHSEKIERMVVGTHFYQTHPSFIAAFISHPHVRFIPQTDDLFHPKVYFFEKPRGAWECIVGSPNFTNGGFGPNYEMAVLVSSEDQGASDALKKINATLDAYWEKASSFGPGDFEAYQQAWKRKRPMLKNLRGKFGNPEDEEKDDKGKAPLDVPILRMTWAAYLDKVKAEKASVYGHSMTERLKVIQVARQLFAKHQQFNRINLGGRRKLAGLDGIVDGVDFGFFGSMKGVGKFWTAIQNNDENLSLALDLIPAASGITREIYLEYIEQYKKAFPQGRHGVATASRLLAMKRPDTFVCLDSKNKKLLCRDFGISRNVGYEKYWDSIVARIMESTWWCSPQPASGVEADVWKARAAFLDSIYYDAEA